MYRSNFLIAFVVLFVLWIFDLLVLQLTGGLVHILLVVAVILLLVHFLRGRP